jgi:two-component system sensor histidine kinase MtrB
MVNTDIGRLRQLVDDLLEISRLEAQAAETVIEPVDIPSFLEQLVRAHGWADAVAIVRPTSTAAEVAPAVPASAGTPQPQQGDALVAHADRRRVERIVVNLVENALRHGDGPVTLEMRSSADAEGERVVQIAVTDRGPGVASEHLPYIFDRFYKADPSRSASRGSGLGLAIARENARLLGGDVTAANVPNGGARFVLTLPPSEA